MNTFFKIISIFALLITLFSCSKSPSPTPFEVRDIATQNAADKIALDTYIDTHYISGVDANLNATIMKIPTGGTNQSIRQQTTYQLLDTTAVAGGISYPIYILKLQNGTQRRPTQVDSIFVSYRGTLADDASTQFDAAPNPIWFRIQEVVAGWSAVLPSFKTGTYTSGGSNPTVFSGYGAGIMFLPSSLGYYASGNTGIGAYAPLIFHFKLYELQYRDHDRDGIFSKDERNLSEVFATRLTNWKANPLGVDTDGDGVFDMFDVDDDGDSFTTKYERQVTQGSPTTTYYSFANIPTCSDGKKRHLSAICH